MNKNTQFLISIDKSCYFHVQGENDNTTRPCHRSKEGGCLPEDLPQTIKYNTRKRN